MGFPTPFPEPASSALLHFAVNAPRQIVSQLHALQVAEVPLNAFLDGTGQFGVVTLKRIERGASALLLAGPTERVLRSQLQSAPALTLVGFVNDGKVQFNVNVLSDEGTSSAEFAVSTPSLLFRLQRRSVVRASVDADRSAVCRIPVPGGTGEREALRVLDISVDGIGLLAYPQCFEPVVGSELVGCRLDLPGVGGISANLRIRRIDSSADDGATRICGCEFLGLPPGVRAALARYVAERVSRAAMVK